MFIVQENQDFFYVLLMITEKMMMFILSYETWTEMSVEFGLSYTSGRLYLPSVVCPLAGQQLYLTAQQTSWRMLRGAALRRVLGFILVIVGLVVFDDVILAAKQNYHTCAQTSMRKWERARQFRELKTGWDVVEKNVLMDFTMILPQIITYQL